MNLACSDILRLLPEHISGDPQFAAAGRALNPVLAKISRAIPNLLIYARLGGQKPESFLPPLRRLTEARGGLSPLSSETLESLAWQFHVDFREAARSDPELAGMVLNSIAWHRIKGTPASIKAALALFGFGGGIYIEEHDPGSHWASYQLGFDSVQSLDDLALILKICNEMQPARCRLWRVYTSDYDYRPGVWSGKLPQNAWSNCWWSGYSGTYFDDLPGLDERGLLVSFGLCRRFLCDQWAKGKGVTVSRSDVLPGLVRIQLYPVWSESNWSDYFPSRMPISLTQIATLHGLERQFEPEIPWLDAPWYCPALASSAGLGMGRPPCGEQKPWANAVYWDRTRPKFRIFNIGIPLAQGVWSEAVDKGGRSGAGGCEAVGSEATLRIRRPPCGGWSGGNSFWSCREIMIAPEAPKWSASHWSDKLPEPEYRRIDEFFYEASASKIAPVSISVSGVGLPQGRAFCAKPSRSWPELSWPAKPWPQARAALLCGHAAQTQKLGGRWPNCAWLSQTWQNADSFCGIGITSESMEG